VDLAAGILPINFRPYREKVNQKSRILRTDSKT